MCAEPPSRPIARRFVRFTVTGVVAAGVDMAVLTLFVRWIEFDLYSARVASYLAAATTAWWMNRRTSFADRSSSNRALEWLRYLAANLLGGTINYAVYAALVSASALFAQHPFLAVAAGSLSGLLSNFAMSQRYVFVGR